MPVAVPVTTTQVTQIGNEDPAGMTFGTSTVNPISFYAATPVPQILQGVLAGANGLLKVYATSQSPAAVTSNTTSEVAMTVTGVAVGDIVVAVVKPTSQAGLAVGTARTSTTNTVALTLGNLTGSTVTPTTTEVYYVVTASAALGFTSVLSPASVAAASVVEQQFVIDTTVPSHVEVGMVVAVNKPTQQAGLMISDARVVSEGIVGITFMNVTTSTVITPTASETYSFFAARGLRIQPVMERLQVTLTPVAVAANTTAEQTFTVTGLIANTAVEVNKPSVTTGLAIVGARVSAANTLAINYGNVTAASITPPSEVYTIGFFPNVAPASGSTNTQLAQMGVEAGHGMSYMGLLSSDATASSQ